MRIGEERGGGEGGGRVAAVYHKLSTVPTVHAGTTTS